MINQNDIILAKKEKDERSLATVFLLLKISAAWNSKNVYKFLNIRKKSLIQHNILGIPYDEAPYEDIQVCTVKEFRALLILK